MMFLRRNNNDYDVFDGFSMFSTSRLQTDAKETEDGYEFKVNVAGIEKSNIKVSYENQYLTISVSEPKKENTEKYLIKEIQTSAAKRSFYIQDADESSLHASLNDGVLTITVKKETKKTPKYISIE